MLKTVRNVAIAVFALLLIFAGGGAAYVLLSGDEEKKQPAVAPPAASSAPTQIKPSKPNPKAPVGASVESLLSPVKIGSNTGLTVHTTAGAACTPIFKYNNIKSTDSGLVKKTADDFGRVSWTWTVDNSVPVGKWPVDVTCKYLTRSAFVSADIQVIK